MILLFVYQCTYVDKRFKIQREKKKKIEKIEKIEKKKYTVSENNKKFI
eukprot:gene46-24_t